MNFVLSAKPDMVVLKPENHGRGFPKGQPGEIRKAWSFFRRNKGGYHFITIELGSEPVLYAVTEEQLKTWKTVPLMAVPMTATWAPAPYGKGDVWHIKDDMDLPRSGEAD